MTREEELRQQAVDSGAEVIDRNFRSKRIKGLYCNGMIAVEDRLTEIEKACVLAEELGHHYTATGNILDQSVPNNRKQELRGRAYAYERLIGLRGIIKAWERGCTNTYEAAEYLEVTEEVLVDALAFYRRRYGLCVRLGAYMIYFEPLGVMKII